VVLDCVARLDERLDCSVESETPARWGFAEAALGLSRSFRANSTDASGAPAAGARTRVPVRFPIATDQVRTWRGVPELPRWEAAPAAADVDAAWQRASRPDGIRGRAVLSCTIKDDRGLDCTLRGESAPSLGFGEAALALAPGFRVSETSGDFIARHREQPFLLPINFGFDPRLEPVNVATTGMEPVQFPAPPREMVYSIYPPSARAASITGSVTVVCIARADGSMACEAASETPTGHGFGEAAVGLMNWALAMMLAGPSPFLEGDRIEATIPFETGS
jgi:hypothetical protein